MVVNYKLTNIQWKENTDLPTELDLPESCLDEEGHPDMELILYWLEDEIGYACDGFEVATKASFQECQLLLTLSGVVDKLRISWRRQKYFLNSSLLASIM